MRTVESNQQWGSGERGDQVGSGSPAEDADLVADRGPVEVPAPARERRGMSGRLGGRRGGVDAFTSSMSTRLFLALIVGAVVAGPAALAMQLGQSAAAPTVAPPAPSAPAVGTAVRAAGVAAHLVRFWLSAGSADSDELAALVAVPPRSLPLPSRRPKPPSWVEVAEVAPTTAGQWRVVVRAGGGLAGRAATYLVLVEVGDTDAMAVALPARVGVAAALAPSRSPLTAVPLSDPAAETVAGFVTALLTGDADLSRWTSPDSTLPSGPRACRTATVTQVLSSSEPAPVNGQDLSVLATVTCATVNTSAGRQSEQSLQYPLVLHARDGRWEVARYADSTPDAASPATPAPPAAAANPQPTTSPTRR